MDETEQILRAMRRPPPLDESEPVYIEDLAETILSDMQSDSNKPKRQQASKPTHPQPD